MPPRALLILDLDETLWHGTPDPTHTTAHITLRPHLRDFLHTTHAAYDHAIWTAASPDWMHAGLQLIHTETGLDLTRTAAFLWHRDRCSWHRDEHGDLQPHKPARKLRATWIRSRYPRERILAIDDRPQNWASGYGHLVRVTPWTGDPTDDELPRLARYLLSIADTPDLRRVEKRGWRGRVLD